MDELRFYGESGFTSLRISRRKNTADDAALPSSLGSIEHVSARIEGRWPLYACQRS